MLHLLHVHYAITCVRLSQVSMSTTPPYQRPRPPEMSRCMPPSQEATTDTSKPKCQHATEKERGISRNMGVIWETNYCKSMKLHRHKKWVWGILEIKIMVLVNAQVMVMVMVMSVVRTMVNFILDVKRLAYLSLYSIIMQCGEWKTWYPGQCYCDICKA